MGSYSQNGESAKERGRGYDIRTLQESLGHRDVNTTMVYTPVLNRSRLGVRSRWIR